MKFLITCNSLDLSGSSTYTYTLAIELIRQGYQVDVFTLFEDEIAKELKKKNIFASSEIEKFNKKYDCIIAQHNVLALIIRGFMPKTPMIFISHGVIPFLEQPPSQDINIYKYIAISEEIKKNLTKKGVTPKNIIIIRNFIDINRFFPLKRINSIPKNALFISNHQNKKNKIIIKEACSSLGIKLKTLGKNKKSFYTEKYITKADIVFSLGRGALESMSCGRAVIIYDYAGGEGIITKNNEKIISTYNFSGRKFQKDFTSFSLAQEIKKYHPRMGEINRKIIEKKYNCETEVKKIINLCVEAKNNFSYKKINIPSAELYYFNDQIKNIYNSKSWKLLLKIKNIFSSLKQ